LTLVGRLDTMSAPALQQPLLAAVKSGADVVLDFSGIEYVSSAGLRVLLQAEKAAEAGGGKLTIANCSPEVMEVFELTSFSAILNFA